MAQLTDQQLAQLFSGNGSMAMPGYSMEDIYGGILPSMGGGNPALNAINAASPGISSGRPASVSAYDVGPGGTVPVSSGVPSLPRSRPGYAPTRMDMAAITDRPLAPTGLATNAVASKMGFNPLFGRPAGSVLSLLGGKVQLPQSGGQGGVLGLLRGLLSGNQGAGALPRLGGSPRVAPRDASGKPIATGGVKARNGATYASGGRDYGSDPGQSTSGLKPGERTYNADTNSWGIK